MRVKDEELGSGRIKIGRELEGGREARMKVKPG
jgi:hypothetical protein